MGLALATTIVTHDRLSEVARRNDGRTRLPTIIKKLWYASGVSEAYSQMPEGDGVSTPGYDGEINKYSGTSEFVPQGASVWELSVEQSISSKANRDYEKRKAEADPEKTYVFVTIRQFPSGEQWAAERRAEGIWKDVRVYNLSKVLDWLALYPGAELSIARALGFTDQGSSLIDLEGAWRAFSLRSDPAIAVDLPLAGRDDSIKQLAENISANRPKTVVKAHGPNEALGFVLATLMKWKEEKPEIEDGIIVAHDGSEAGMLADANSSIIVDVSGELDQSRFDFSKHKLIIPVGNSALNLQARIELDQPSRDQFCDALEASGIERDDARRRAIECGRSVTLFQRRFPSSYGGQPEWLSDHGEQFIPAIMLGQWDWEYEGDKNVVEAVSENIVERAYKDLIESSLSLDDPPFERVKNVWAVRAPADAISCTGNLWVSSDFERLKAAALAVFSSTDKRVDAIFRDDEKESLFVQDTAGYSEIIRDGLARTLGWLAVLEEAVEFSNCPKSAQEFVNDIATELGKRGWRFFADQRYHVSDLMEAAPEPFMEALEESLEGGDFANIFHESGDTMFGNGPFHTGLLWGLERLAWHPSYFGRAVMLLAKLASIDPGGRLSNRPINSLFSLFVPWCPQTNAPLEERINVFKRLMHVYPDLVWPLLSDLLPSTSGQSVSSNPKLKWRDAGGDSSGRVLRSEYFDFVNFLLDNAITAAGGSLGAWEELLRRLGVLTPEFQIRALHAFKGLANAVGQRTEDWWRLGRNALRQHETYPNADWTLKGDSLAILRDIESDIRPASKELVASELFESAWPEFPGSGDLSRSASEMEKELHDLRVAAVSGILSDSGIEGIVKFAGEVNETGIVIACALEIIDEGQVSSFVEQVIADTRLADRVGWAFTPSRLGRQYSWFVEKALAGEFPIGFVATALASRSIDLELIELVGELGDEVASQFWNMHGPSRLVDDESVRAKQIDNLILFGQAVTVLAWNCGLGKELTADQLVRLMLAVLEEQDEEKIQKQLGVHLRNILEHIAEREDLPDEVVVRFEWYFASALGSFIDHQTRIHKLMAKEPEAFMNIIKVIFKNDADEQGKDMGGNSDRALNAYRVLSNWESVPGFLEAPPSISALITWVEEVRKLAGECGRLTISDEYIGQVLAHSPNGDDGVWPHEVVREFYETHSNESVSIGFGVGVRNSRGVTTRAVMSGGELEREEAAKYRAWAAECNKWPKISKALNEIAKDYDRDAQWHDEKAEIDRLRYEG